MTSNDRNQDRAVFPWNPMRVFRAARRAIRFLRTDLSGAERFLIFIGNPRSGTTLVRSLLNAHPAVILSNEIHAVRRMASGESWNSVVGRILENEQQFTADPVWTGYSYEVPPSDVSNRSQKIRVIGDKKAGATSKVMLENPELLREFCQWCRLPVQIIHCVRHPCDVITTKTRRNGESLATNIERYFSVERTAASVLESADIAGSIQIFQENLIREPATTVQELLQSIGLDATDGFLRACESVIYEKPNLSRFGLPWSDAAIRDVEERTKEVPHLHAYLSGNRLQFHEENAPTDCSSMDAAA